MKFRLPPECRGVSLGGETLVIAANGTIEADTTAALALAAHGILRADEPVAEPASRSKGRQDKAP